MILVIGGRGAGKRSFVTDVLGFSPEQFAENGPVLYGLEELDPLPPLEALLGRAVGRLCCDLAREAEAVYRLQCGLAMRLK